MKKGQQKVYWTKQEHDVLFKLIDKYGLEAGCTKAASKFNRSINACKCRYYRCTDVNWNKIEYREPKLNQQKCAAYLAKEIQQNPLNLQTCFKNTAKEFGVSQSYIHALYYENKYKDSPMHRDHINGFYIVSNVTAHNAKSDNCTKRPEKRKTKFLLTLLNKLFNINGED